MKKEYLGDGVYVAFDGYCLVLSAEETAILLEPTIYNALLTYVNNLPDEDRREFTSTAREENKGKNKELYLVDSLLDLFLARGSLGESA